MNYYNEFDPFAAQWLRNLISNKVIAQGEVDARSITEVTPADLDGFTQCHFFAGIGVWSHALSLAGWSDDRPVWTGSCPCQPFSAAGEQGGFDDERHLWPAWFELIRQCKPSTVFGEQVASAAALAWLDHVQSDMENAGYAFGAFDLCAAGVGAPQIRQRIYFVGDAEYTGLEGHARAEDEGSRSGRIGENEARSASTAGVSSGVADTDGDGQHSGLAGNSGGEETSRGEHRDIVDRRGASMRDDSDRPGSTNGFWRSADWLRSRDGKWRPVEPGTFPLGDGASSRVGRLRAYGNAIVPQVAAEMISAFMECKPQ